MRTKFFPGVLRPWPGLPRAAACAPSLQCPRPGWTGSEQPALLEGVPAQGRGGTG